MRFLYRILSLLSTGKAASKGAKPLGKNLIRRQAHKSLAQVLRRLL